MSVISGHIFRPLLFTPKEVIYAYQKENAIAYRADSSNDDTTYERNRIRHDIIPVLSALNPRIQEMFGELALYMQEMTEFVREYVEIWMTDAFTKSGKEKSFFASDFLALSPLMR